MKKDFKFYLKLFLSTCTLSAFTFGGGYVIITLMKKKFVEKYHWMDEKEMLDLTALAQSAPGAIAINASILVGFRMAGVWGALVSVFGTVLPPLITLSIVSLFYQAFKSSAVVAAILKGMQAAVSAVILDVVFSMGQTIWKEKNASTIAVMILSFIAAYILKINVMFIILICAALGAFTTSIELKKEKEGHNS